MPKLRIKLAVVIDTDLTDINAGQVFVDTSSMSSEDWVDACRDYIANFPEEVLDMLQEGDLLEQVTDNAEVEYVSAS